MHRLHVRGRCSQSRGKGIEERLLRIRDLEFGLEERNPTLDELGRVSHHHATTRSAADHRFMRGALCALGERDEASRD